MAEEVPERLPRGRHRLTREQVEASQRTRVYLALAVAMAEKGYVRTTVADVLARSGVGRESFYQLFDSKEDCFLGAFDVACEMLVARLDRVAEEVDGGPLDRFDRALAEYLDVLAEQPDMARVFLIEVYAAGPAALARRAELHDKLVERMSDVLEAGTEEERFACQVVVAALSTLVTAPLLAHDVDGLRALRGRFVDLVRAALASRIA